MMRTTALFATTLAISTATGDAAGFDLATSLATKSSYWDQSKDPLGPASYVKDATPEEEAQYTLVQVQNVVRHGTRFPTKGNTGEIQALLAKLQANYSAVLPAWMQTYSLPYNLSVEGELASAGTEETQAFGTRARTRIGDALPRAYSAEKFLVEHTYKPRTKDTAKAFISTFFSNPEEVVFVEHPKTADVLFRFFDECPRYQSEIAENAAALAEVDAFKASAAFQENIDTLRAALNLPADANITALDVESAFSACAFDLALYKIHSNWCSLLSEAFIKTCEYAEDLDVFIENSAGAKISYEISAVLLRDIYQTFSAFAQNNSTRVGHLRFVHAETVLPLLTLLGYADKTPLRANATAADIESRTFRSSRLGPFMANLEFRLYTKRAPVSCTFRQSDCSGGDETAHYVQIRVNEQPTAVPGCGGAVFCALTELQQIWSYYLTEYDFDQACAV